MRKILLVVCIAFASLVASSQAVAQISRECNITQDSPQCMTQAHKTVQQDAGQATTGNNTMPNLLAESTIAPNTKTLFSFKNAVMLTANVMAARFIPYAIGIATLLGTIAFIWLGILIMLSQADIWHMGLRPLFMLIMKVGFTFWFLFDYSYLTTAVSDGFLFAANILTGVGSSTASGSTIGAVVQALFKDITTMESIMSEFTKKAIFSGGNFFSDAIHLMLNLPNDLLDGLIIDVTTLIAFVVFILFLVLYLVYQIVLAIAIAVGPVFIPFLILPETKGLFDGWLKMLIMGGIYLMTSTVIVGLVGTAMVTYVSQMNTQLSGTGDFLNLGTFVELIILEFVSIGALLKTHEFAHAIAGSVNIGGINPGGAIAKGAKRAVGLK
ncbi:type IV secretion system protein [Acidithiobacillus caldus]|uniref:Type IV secretion system protein VirB6 n=1 Tax=Acidithiobacillus caldus TaxID=33059 RepID=A0A1E7YQE5_9PROT|nr:type IV secretion system protein [Acidithiobacillus caldus]OFC37976.1 hypothetical protein BAE27_03255 [Acidithiobacillus caldus]OFC38417.1 hypothetical protein BAE28_05590 [Acidithiobacillus caldus]OFC40013.1 hypothetical protein BAE29_06205 [Acidithiobacillus caldus]